MTNRIAIRTVLVIAAGLGFVAAPVSADEICGSNAYVYHIEIIGDEEIVTCDCDPGYFTVGGQCLPRDRARAELRRQLELKAIAYQGAVDRVKHTANAFGFHIDAMGYSELRDLKPKLPYIVGALVVLTIYKNPKNAADLTTEAISAAVGATTAALVFVTDVLNDCNFRNFETMTMCSNFRMAVLDLQPRIDAFTAAREKLAELD